MPKQYASEERPHHPFLDDYAHGVDYDTHFTAPADVTRAIASYIRLVSTMNESVWLVQKASSEGLSHFLAFAGLLSACPKSGLDDKR